MTLLRFLENAPAIFNPFEAFIEEGGKGFFDEFPFDIRSQPLGSFPAVNVIEEGTGVRVAVVVPGLKKEELSLEMEGNVLTVQGNRVQETRDKGEVYRQERFHGHFKRVISLPDYIDPGTGAAKLENGILEVVFSKIEEKQTKKIQISN